MDEGALRKANQAYMDYCQAIECGAPAAEQTRLLEQWRLSYWQFTSRADWVSAREKIGAESPAASQMFTAIPAAANKKM